MSDTVGYQWCVNNLSELFDYFENFICIKPDVGVVFAHWDEEELQAFKNDLAPSELAQVYFTHTSLWIIGQNIISVDDLFDNDGTKKTDNTNKLEWN